MKIAASPGGSNSLWFVHHNLWRRFADFKLRAHFLDLRDLLVELSRELRGLLFELGCENRYLFLLLRDRCLQLLNFVIEHGFLEIVSDDFPVLHAHLNAMNVFWNHGQAGSHKNYLPGDRCRDGPHLNFCATGFFRRIQQKLASAKINGSRPFAHTKDSFLAKAGDRLILESQLTPGLDTGLHGRALANIIVHCSRTR